MNKKWLLGLFLVVCLLQITIPTSMIHKRESTLKHGEVFKFKTAPVDPFDAFRGRYMALSFEQSSLRGSWSASEFRRGRTAYAKLTTDEDGYALISDVQFDKPNDQAFLKVRIHWQRGMSLVVNLPFDRFYMDEFDAPLAEREIIRWGRERQVSSSYAIIRVRNGFGVIEDLIVEDKPIRDWLASRRAE